MATRWPVREGLGRLWEYLLLALLLREPLGVVGLMFLARPLASSALKFGPPEYFSLMVLGLIILIYLTQKSLIKAIIMGAFGLILSFVGMDIVSGQNRFTYNIDELFDGISDCSNGYGTFWHC